MLVIVATLWIIAGALFLSTFFALMNRCEHAPGSELPVIATAVSGGVQLISAADGHLNANGNLLAGTAWDRDIYPNILFLNVYDLTTHTLISQAPTPGQEAPTPGIKASRIWGWSADDVVVGTTATDPEGDLYAKYGLNADGNWEYSLLTDRPDEDELVPRLPALSREGAHAFVSRSKTMSSECSDYVFFRLIVRFDGRNVAQMPLEGEQDLVGLAFDRSLLVEHRGSLLRIPWTSIEEPTQDYD